ncbi:hypothetical protein BD833_10569 [Blastococcus xanthinilyticus]|uniref:Fibronectin type-III domain-containing protein n=2 Tax=Blastococcus xanthinilyticus TaxID=1564164 RepID=A0A5S5CWB6_9ACTN|nr:hypothetical protein BD833_10569 [Blastococcus xanthinilyticus]
MLRTLTLRLAVVAFALVPLLLAADPASAAWATKGAGPARAQAVVIPQTATPAATKATPAPQYLPVYTLTWTTTKHSGGRGVIGYQVRRTQWQGSGLVVTSGTCAGTTVDGMPNVFVPSDPDAPTQSCTDLDAYTSGTVSYTVTPVMGRWTGPTSTSSPSYS